MFYCTPLQSQEEASSFLFDVLLDKPCDPLACDPLSDPGYFSACSSLSPASSVDSCSFSPNSLQMKKEHEPQDCFTFSGTLQQPATTIKPASASAPTKTSRSKYPGKKRETASEREKLRMRDLTKALHHLRSFLPASVAPEGQTLTKIETLRLTIRYITHLSAQLGLSEEILSHKRAPGHMEQTAEIIALQEISCSPQPGAYFGASTSPLVIPAELCYNTQGWVHQQQYSHMGFNGQC